MLNTMNEEVNGEYIEVGGIKFLVKSTIDKDFNPQDFNMQPNAYLFRKGLLDAFNLDDKEDTTKLKANK